MGMRLVYGLLMFADCDVCLYFVRSLLIIRVKDHFKNNVGFSDHFKANVFSVVCDLLSFKTENHFYSFHNRYFLLNIFTYFQEVLKFVFFFIVLRTAGDKPWRNNFGSSAKAKRSLHKKSNK